MEKNTINTENNNKPMYAFLPTMVLEHLNQPVKTTIIESSIPEKENTITICEEMVAIDLVENNFNENEEVSPPLNDLKKAD